MMTWVNKAEVVGGEKCGVPFISPRAMKSPKSAVEAEEEDTFFLSLSPTEVVVDSKTICDISPPYLLAILQKVAQF